MSAVSYVMYIWLVSSSPMVANDFLKLSSGTYSTISDFYCSSFKFHLRKFCICHKLWWHIVYVKGYLLQSESVNLQSISFLTFKIASSPGWQNMYAGGTMETLN